MHLNCECNIDLGDETYDILARETSTSLYGANAGFSMYATRASMSASEGTGALQISPLPS